MTTFADLQTLCRSGRPDILAGFAACADDVLAQYAISTALRRAHFWAQVAHESDGMRTLTEYASGREYQGRADLGNLQPGDGVRYKGRGPFQLTGRINYAREGRILGLDLIDHPELLEEPRNGLESAGLYWQTHNLNIWADADDIDEITLRINGGYNGLASRQAYLTIAKTIFVRTTGFGPVAGEMTPAQIQAALNTHGASPTLVVDGNIGVMSVQAIEAFQKAAGLAADGIPGKLTQAKLLEPAKPAT